MANLHWKQTFVELNIFFSSGNKTSEIFSFCFLNISYFIFLSARSSVCCILSFPTYPPNSFSAFFFCFNFVFVADVITVFLNVQVWRVLSFPIKLLLHLKCFFSDMFFCCCWWSFPSHSSVVCLVLPDISPPSFFCIHVSSLHQTSISSISSTSKYPSLEKYPCFYNIFPQRNIPLISYRQISFVWCYYMLAKFRALEKHGLGNLTSHYHFFLKEL